MVKRDMVTKKDGLTSMFLVIQLLCNSVHSINTFNIIILALSHKTVLYVTTIVKHLKWIYLQAVAVKNNGLAGIRQVSLEMNFGAAE